MDRFAPTAPRLIDLLRPVPAAGPKLPVRDAIQRFNRDSGLLALPVMENGRLVGLLRRSLFFRALSRPYALELFNKEPISELLEGRPFNMGPGEGIHQALAFLLQVDPTLEADCFPIVEEDRCLGIVAVSDLMMAISRDQKCLLTRLEELGSRIREEVAKAAGIQHALLPPDDFTFPGVDLAAELVNSTEVGGDYYDYFVVDRERLGVVIADVSGHGVQAGMVTTAAKASLNTLVNQGVTMPGRILEAMNGAILVTTRQSLLMTCLVALIDRGRGNIRYANAGHNFPYLYRRRDDTLVMLEDATGFPLGFEADGTYQERSVGFEPGDTFICYSDGISECSNGSEEFGYDRLGENLYRFRNSPPREMVAGILASIRRHAGQERFEDDVTLVIARATALPSDTDIPTGTGGTS